MSPSNNLENIPRHVAIIMDGNGRWAQQRNLPRIQGHRTGAKSVRASVETACELGMDYLTLYAFSLENWNRPETEVNALMHLLHWYLKKEVAELNRLNVRLVAIGQLDNLPKKAREELNSAIDTLKANTGLTLVLALSYGGRAEIVDAARSIANDVCAGHLSIDDIDEKVFGQHLYMKDLPDVDLLVRTSGEMRISNFLLWQISYAEIHVAETLWPDFRRPQFLQAIEDYGQRNRRFGRVTTGQLS